VHANLRLGAQGRQLGMERGKARSGITLLAIQPCEQSLLLGDGLQQRLAAYPLTGALLPVASRLGLVLHRASRPFSPPTWAGVNAKTECTDAALDNKTDQMAMRTAPNRQANRRLHRGG